MIISKIRRSESRVSRGYMRSMIIARFVASPAFIIAGFLNLFDIPLIYITVGGETYAPESLLEKLCVSIIAIILGFILGYIGSKEMRESKKENN